MKIAFLLPFNGISGGLFVAYRHAHYLASRGHEVAVVFLSDHNGTRVTHYPDFNLPVRTLDEVVDSDSDFDVVISGWWECFYAMFNIRAGRYLHFVQGDDRQAMRSIQGPGRGLELPFIERAFADKHVGFIVVARWLKADLEKEPGLCVAYAPNGIDTPVFHPGVKPLAPRGPRPRVLIEGAGKLPFKRVDLAFRVARTIPGAELWYVSGDGCVEANWQAHRIFRSVPMQNMPAIYASCDILLKLSVLEGFFGPPLEMMATGGTAVVSRVAGHDEYVIDGHNALTVPLDDEAAAREALTRLVRDGELRRRLAHNGLQTARQLDWAQRCPLCEEAVQTLIERVPTISARERAGFLMFDRLRLHLESCVRELTELRQGMKHHVGPSLRSRLKRRLKKTLSYWPLADRLARQVHAWLRDSRHCSLPGTTVSDPANNDNVTEAPGLAAQPREESGQRAHGTGMALPIVFAAQPEYFRAAYYDATFAGKNFDFPVTSADPSRFKLLPNFVRRWGIRTCLIFRPEWLAPYPEVLQELQSLGVTVIGYSTEPVPTQWSPAPHPDQLARFRSLQGALALPYDLIVHFDPSSVAFLRHEGFKRLTSHPLPVSERLFFPEDRQREFDVCFLGRSTPHREEMLARLKMQFRTVHVAHGLCDEHARVLMNQAKLVLNLHNDKYPNFETRVVQALRCGRPLVSEPLTGNCLLPGRDYQVVRTPAEVAEVVAALLQREPSECSRADLSPFTITSLLDELACSLAQLRHETIMPVAGRTQPDEPFQPRRAA